jgi:L-lactate utilization protein LutC
MRSIRSLFAALTVLALFATSAFAFGSYIHHKDVKWREVGIAAARDTTFMTDEADTTRTEWISTADWDWEAMIGSGVAASQGGPVVKFWSANLTNNGVTDTLYYTVERGIKRGNIEGVGAGDTVIAVPQTTITAGTFLVAISSITSPNNNVWEGTLNLDVDAQPSPATHVGNIYLAEYIRFRVSGDVSGTTPKISQLRCRISYLKRR